jgi:hypothetical protein
MTTIVLLVGAGPGKDNAFSLAVGVQMMIDELATIVRVEPQHGEGQSLTQLMHCCAYAMLAFAPYSNTF